MAHQTAPEPFLTALVTGRTVAEAAESAGISRRTAFRRLADPDTQARLDELRSAPSSTPRRDCSAWLIWRRTRSAR